jgi:cytochrome b6-f complex iron-sulfur subunit
MADPIEPNNADEKAAKIAELQAKMAEAKARREAAQAGGESAPVSSAPSGSSPAAPPGSDADKAAKIAELQAKMAAAKAKRESGEAAAPAAAAGAAAGTATATAETATAAAPKSEADSRIAAMRAKIAEERKAGGPPKPLTNQPKQVKDDTETGVWFLGRRNFLQSIGWMSFFGFLTIVILGALRAMFPRVIYERPPIFKAGFPGDYVPGAVSEKYKDEERVWIIRQNDGSFVALLAICTHLGCTPRWLASENKFKCPCHGSGFRGNPTWGVNFEGPAPRPLERVAIHLAPDGQIEIDTSKKFLWEKQQWEDPAATLKA